MDIIYGVVLLTLGVAAISIEGNVNSLSSCGNYGLIYVVSLLVLCVFWCVIAAFLTLCSKVGSPMQTELRSQVPILLSTRALLAVIFVANNIMGLAWWGSEDDGKSCKDFGHLSVSLLELTILVQTLCTAYIVYFYGIICCCCRRKILPKAFGGSSAERNTGEVRLSITDDYDHYMADVCGKKCRGFCNMFVDSGGAMSAYDVVGRLLALFYEGDATALTGDDIAMGLWLVQREQRVREKALISTMISDDGTAEPSVGAFKDAWGSGQTPLLLANQSTVAEVPLAPGLSAIARKVSKLEKSAKTTMHYQTSSTKFKHALFSNSNADDVKMFLDLYYYYKYALGIYGDLLYIYSNLKSCRVCNILCCSNALHCCAPGSKFQTPRSCCSRACTNCVYRYGAQYAAMLKTINVPNENDILYVTFKNTLVHSPFFVLLDHEKKTIVYSIRGTLSLDDCVKDVVAEEMILDEVGKEWGFDGVGEYCHQGMFDTTMTMINTLKKRKLLPCIDNNAIPEVAKHYDVVFTGHSLGAGVATLASLLLKNLIPNLRGIVYSPVPNLSPGLIARTRAYITGITSGIDLVARLNPVNVFKLRDRVIKAVKHTQLEKYKVLNAVACGCCANKPEILVHEPTYGALSGHGKGEDDVVYPLRPMYIGCRVLHAVVITESVNCCTYACSCLNALCFDPQRQYALHWVEDNTKEFQEIIIGARMAADHFPDVLRTTIDRIKNQFAL